MTHDELKKRTRELIEAKRQWANDTEADVLQALLDRIARLEYDLLGAWLMGIELDKGKDGLHGTTWRRNPQHADERG